MPYDNLEVIKKVGNINAKSLKAISGRQSIRFQKKEFLKEMKKNLPDVSKKLEDYLVEVKTNLNLIKYVPTD